MLLVICVLFACDICVRLMCGVRDFFVCCVCCVRDLNLCVVCCEYFWCVCILYGVSVILLVLGLWCECVCVYDVCVLLVCLVCVCELCVFWG